VASSGKNGLAVQLRDNPIDHQHLPPASAPRFIMLSLTALASAMPGRIGLEVAANGSVNAQKLQSGLQNAAPVAP
jgi:hypothetical protein